MDFALKKIVFVSYAGDAEKTKDKVFTACGRFNIENKDTCKYTFHPTDWQTGVPREAGPEPQEQINPFIKKADIFIGILEKKFGSKTTAINPETGREYESGIHLEFHEALRKKKVDNSFHIAFFIRNHNSNLKATREEKEQLKKIEQFREELKQKKIFIYELDDKIEITSEVNSFLKYLVNIYDDEVRSLEQLKQRYPIEIKKEEKVEHIDRSILRYKDAVSPEYTYLRYLDNKSIIEVLEKESRIVLLADAGDGKTTELEMIEIRCAQQKVEYYPITIKLKLYTNDKLEDLLPPFWKEIPEKFVLLLLDGFDEIPSENKIIAAREIEKFSTKYKNCKIIVTCRTNFYTPEYEDKKTTIKNPATLESFTTYVLNILSYADYTRYIRIRLGDRADTFIDIVTQNNSVNLLTIPFYLRFLVDEYDRMKKLPLSRNEIFERLVSNRFQQSEQHFRTTSPNKLTDKTILKHLEKLGLVMEILCRNYIHNDEFEKIIPDEKVRNILSMVGIWFNREDRWEFDHNNFQEYLAAKALSTVPINRLIKIITFPPTYKVINPSWVNTLSFLLNNYKDESLKKWVMKEQPEITIKFERERLGAESRNKIFKKIFNNYKSKKTWIDRDKYNYYELAKFGESSNTLVFLFEYVTLNTDYTTITNALNLLMYFEIPFDYKRRIKSLLLKIILEYDNVIVNNDAMLTLGMTKLYDKESLSIIYEKYKDSDNDWIRYGMYFLLEDSNYLDTYIDYFLDGIQYYLGRIASGGETPRISGESTHLENGLQKIKTKDAALKIIDHLLTKPEIVHLIGFDRVIPDMIHNFANIYLNDNEIKIFDKMLELYQLFNKKYHKYEASLLLVFFEETNTRRKAFDSVYHCNDSTNAHDKYKYLAQLSNEECCDYIIEEHMLGRITEQEIWLYKTQLLPKINEYFHKKINLKTNNKFIPEPMNDFSKERDELEAKELTFLFNKQAFLVEIDSLFERENLTDLTKELIDEISYTRYNEAPIYTHKVLRVLSELIDDGTKTHEEIREKVEKKDWDDYSIEEIYNLLNNGKEIDLDEEKRLQLEYWFNNNISKVDFKDSIHQTKEGITGNSLAIRLNYFFRIYNFLTCQKEILLDMISFDWHNSGIEYLEKHLSIEEIAGRILENLTERSPMDHELRNYFSFCLKHKVTEVKTYAVKEIINPSCREDTRELALKLFCELSPGNRYIYQLLIKVKDNFKWKIVERLVNANDSKTKVFLNSILKKKNTPIPDKLIASNYLMQMQELSGLKFYTEYLESEKSFQYNRYNRNGISMITSTKSLPYVMRLLLLFYDQNLKDDNYDSLYRVVENILTNIALKSEPNFKKIRNAVIVFIKKNKKIDRKINFLHSYIERLERQFYFSKAQNISLEEAIKKMNSVKI